MAAHPSAPVLHNLYGSVHEDDETQDSVRPDEAVVGRIEEKQISLFKDIALPMTVRVVALVFEVYLLNKFFSVLNNKS